MHIIYNKFNTMSIVDKIDRESKFGLYIININKYHIFGSSISEIVGLTTKAVFVGKSKINKNNTTDFTPSRIPDTTIGTGSSDYSSDQNTSNTLGFETSTSVIIAIATIAVYLN